MSAALGTKWAHAVNVRLVLERRGKSRVVTVSAVTDLLLLCCAGVCFVRQYCRRELWLQAQGQNHYPEVTH